LPHFEADFLQEKPPKILQRLARFWLGVPARKTAENLATPGKVFAGSTAR
jgi:hypothetical protein